MTKELPLIQPDTKIHSGNIDVIPAQAGMTPALRGQSIREEGFSKGYGEEKETLSFEIVKPQRSFTWQPLPAWLLPAVSCLQQIPGTHRHLWRCKILYP